MGTKTKIEWCDVTFSPITGCYGGCPYCYARTIAQRFGGWNISAGRFRANIAEDKTYICLDSEESHSIGCKVFEHNGCKVADLRYPYFIQRFAAESGYTETKAPYPFGFAPTFHRYRLEAMRIKLQNWRDPRTIFWGSMADMFGEWIPAEWIKEILKICTSVPQHRHLFLTKNPERYSKVFDEGSFIDRSDRLWFGQTVTKPKDYIFLGLRHTFVNLEPLLSGNGTERMFESLTSEESTGVILGAMTGPGSKKHQPKREWIDSICAAADEAGIPVFMKDSLAGIVGEENMRRELPWA